MGDCLYHGVYHLYEGAETEYVPYGVKMADTLSFTAKVDMVDF